MLTFNRRTKIYACTQPVALNYSYDGLFAMARDLLKEDPLSGHLFLFVNRKGNACKCLYWDGTGLVILSKRLEKGQFSRFNENLGRIEMTAAEFALFFEGADLARRFIESPAEFSMKSAQNQFA